MYHGTLPYSDNLSLEAILRFVIGQFVLNLMHQMQDYLNLTTAETIAYKCNVNRTNSIVCTFQNLQLQFFYVWHLHFQNIMPLIFINLGKLGLEQFTLV